MPDDIQVYRESTEPEMQSGEAFYYYVVTISGTKYFCWARTQAEAIADAQYFRHLQEEEEQEE